MADLPLVKNTTGSHLNRYMMTSLSDGDIELSFHPGDDYVPGTAFDEDLMNPIIRKLNAHDLDPIRNLTIPASQFKNSLDYARYPYCADIAIEGLLETDGAYISYAPDTLDLDCMAEQGRTLPGILRLYAYEIPTSSITIDSVFIDRRGVD